MNVSSISPVNSTPSPYPTASPDGFGQLVTDFQAIGSALQSGNVSSAQSALTAFQQVLPGSTQPNSQTAATQPFGKNSQANTDFQNLTSALQSGNLATAQQAFASLQNDLKSAQSANSVHKGHHHHHHGSSATAATSSSTTPATGSTASSAVDAAGSLNVFA